MDRKTYKKLEFDIILNKLAEAAVTEEGKKRALDTEPFTDPVELNISLNELSQAQSLILRRGNPPINSVNDVLLYIKRLNISATLREKELLDIARLLNTARRLKDYASEDTELSMYFDSIIPLKNLEDEITVKIISEGEIADNASVKLSSIRRKIKSTHDKIRDILNKYITSPQYQKYLQDCVVTMRGDRLVLPVKIENKSNIPGIIHDTSTSGSTVFIEPMPAVNVNNELKELFSQEADEIERILYELSAKASEHREAILNNYELICDLDYIFAKAKLSVYMKATLPKINHNGILDLKKARHPLIAADVVVPINVNIGKEYDTLIITGPNTGGKTVSLKTVGLCSLMALSGMMIPASDNSEVPFYKNIFADIGDEQSITQSLSTFSSHMTNIVKITENAEKDTLVLLDELGAGTDPVEGASLAIGVIEYLRDKGASVMATTHYSELKLYALSTKGVQNAGCEFDVETLRPTYKLLVGIPGKSNAFAISEKIGINTDIINKAKAHLTDDNIKFEDVLSEIEDTRKMLENEKQLTLKYKNEIDDLREKLSKQKTKSEEQYAEIINRANIEAKEILEDAKETADNYIKELQKLKKAESQREFDRQASKTREGLASKIKNRQKEISSPGKKGYKTVSADKLIPGTSVILIEHEQNATVITTPDKEGNLTVMAGILKINVNIKDIALGVDNDKPSQVYTASKKLEIKNTGRAATEIDLRGMTVTDAVMDTEKFLDDAMILRLEKVAIIHGKGTGALRSAIHSMLKTNKMVKSFRLGKYGEGEDGITIVELKK